MNKDMNPVDVSSICQGCLSVGRELAPVRDEACRRFIADILGPMGVPVVLEYCWECVARASGAVRFASQVRMAQPMLTNYLANKRSALPCLSPLSWTRGPASSRPGDPAPLALVKMEHLGDSSEGQGVWLDDQCGDAKCQNTAAPVQATNTKEYTSNVKLEILENEPIESDDEPLMAKRMKRDSNTVSSTTDKVKRKRKKDRVKTANAKGSKGCSRGERPPGVAPGARASRLHAEHEHAAADGRVQMVLMTWEQVYAERERALSNPAYLGRRFRCGHCALGFNHRLKLDRHMRKHTSASGSCVCSVCSVHCRDKRALAAHSRRHRLRWRCVVCGWSVSRAALAADHVARKHPLARGEGDGEGEIQPEGEGEGQETRASHVCRTCGHTEATLSRLRNHQRGHNERAACRLCPKTFRDRGSLGAHMLTHVGEREFSCGECEKRFLFRRALELHQLTHQPHQHLYCHTCDFTFKNQMSFYQHMRYSLKHIDPALLKFACSLCGAKFAKGSRLKEHHTAVHLKATPLACTEAGCPFACASRPVLRAHMRTTHRGGTTQRNHMCHTCGKAYLHKKTLEGHLRAHSGERPFACALCASTFGYEAALYNHTRLVHHRKGAARREGSTAADDADAKTREKEGPLPLASASTAPPVPPR